MPVKLQVRKYGAVPDEKVDKILNKLRESYKKFGEGPPTVEVLVFAKKKDLELFKKREEEYLKTEFGVRFSPISPKSAVTHYAWFDYPTIAVCLETYESKDPDLSTVELIRSAVHSILHGSRKYYFFKMPPLFQRLYSLDFLEKQVIDIGFYLLTVGVKGFEVSKYLAKKDPESFPLYKKLYKYHLTITEEEATLWKKNAALLDMIFLLFLDNLKVLMEASPFAYDFHDDELKELIKLNIFLYPPIIHEDVQHFLWTYIQDLTENTIDKIELVTPRITWMTKKIEQYIKQHYML